MRCLSILKKKQSDNFVNNNGNGMIGSRQAEIFLQRLQEEKRPSNQDILGALEQSFIRQLERESDLRVHRLFGGYYVRRRFFASVGRDKHRHQTVS
jgi:hypothetical protein